MPLHKTPGPDNAAGKRAQGAADFISLTSSRALSMLFRAVLLTGRRKALSAFAAACLVLTGCGGGGGSDDSQAAAASSAHDVQALAVTRPQAMPTVNTLSTKVVLPGFPHQIDIYQPAGATRAIVFLHGQNGRNYSIAYSLGLNKWGTTPTMNSVNWDWLTKNKVIAVFPQGQALPATPTSYTWSNRMMDSGQDDVAFLSALSAYLKNSYAITQVSLAGHSMGGMMTHRMHCEATTAYDAYVSTSGPGAPYYMNASTPCSPSAPAPYLVLLGGRDTVITAFGGSGPWSPTPEQTEAGLVNATLANELTRHQSRSTAVCGETPSIATRIEDTTGATWSNCSARTIYRLVDQADHTIPSFELYTGSKMIDTIAAFTAAR